MNYFLEKLFGIRSRSLLSHMPSLFASGYCLRDSGSVNFKEISIQPAAFISVLLAQFSTLRGGLIRNAGCFSGSLCACAVSHDAGVVSTAPNSTSLTSRVPGEHRLFTQTLAQFSSR